ncbi:MAG: hypothetical protein C0P74_007850 [Gammaproteobacteria bacterium]
MSEQTDKPASTGMTGSFAYRGRSRGRAARLWSREEIRQLRELANAGVPAQVIAARLRRTVSAIKNKAGLHGISVRTTGTSTGPSQ